MEPTTKRFLISIPYYADSEEEVTLVMDKIAKTIDVPYISVSTQFEEDEYVVLPLTSKEYL